MLLGGRARWATAVRHTCPPVPVFMPLSPPLGSVGVSNQRQPGAHVTALLWPVGTALPWGAASGLSTLAAHSGAPGRELQLACADPGGTAGPGPGRAADHGNKPRASQRSPAAEGVAEAVRARLPHTHSLHSLPGKARSPPVCAACPQGAAPEGPLPLVPVARASSVEALVEITGLSLKGK